MFLLSGSTPTVIDAWNSTFKVHEGGQVADAQVLRHIHVIGLHKLDANLVCLIVYCLKFCQDCLAGWAVVIIWQRCL